MKVDVNKGFELGPFHYEVLSDKKTDAELRSRQRYGETSFTEHKVCISNDFSAEQYHDTFLHECIEAIGVMFCDDKIKHEYIKNISHGLAQILRSLDIQFAHSRRGMPKKSPEAITK